MKIGDLVRVKWTHKVSKMRSQNVIREWARDNTPLLIIDVLKNDRMIVTADSQDKIIHSVNLTMRMW
jgi:hypothetical protein